MKLTTLAIAAALGVTSAQAALTTLNFDGAVDTDITNDYAGLTFRSPVAANGPVRSWSFAGADTPGNVLGLGTTFTLNQADGQAIDTLDFTSLSANIRAVRLSAFAPGSAVIRRGIFDTLT